MRKQKERIARLALIIFTFSLLCAGCIQNSIREEEIRADLPALDPQAGIAKEISCNCYAQVLNEAYLTGTEQTIEVRAGERTEYAIVDALLRQRAAVSGAMHTLFPEGTRIVDVTLDGTILYVTFSNEFLGRSLLTEQQNIIKKDWESGRYTEAEYQKRLDMAEADYYKQRSLAVYAVVNTLTEYSEKIRVLIMVDTDNTGSGTRLPYSEFGLSGDGEIETNIIEPMDFNEDVIITPQRMTELFLEHMKNGEYEPIYALLVMNPEINSEKPDYAQIEAELRSFGSLKSYSVNGIMNGDSETAYANIDISFTKKTGETVSLGNQRLLLRKVDGLFRPDYSFLKRLLEEL